MKIPVLEVDAQILFSNEVVTNVIYQDSLRSSVFQVGIAESTPAISGAQVFPNPASGNCTLTYQLANAGNVELSITDLSGRKIRTIENGYQPAGNHAQQIGLEGLSAGMYFIQIISGSAVMTQKISIQN
jgi:hypothetical protein